MKWVAVFLVLTFAGLLIAQEGSPNDEAEVRTFIDDFFSEFAALNPMLYPDKNKAATPLVAYTVSHFTKVTDEDRRSGRIQPADLVASLLMHGPKGWQLSNLKVAGDAARVDINFESAEKANSPDIPMSFRMIRSSDGWKFTRFIDMRPEEIKPEIKAIEELQSGGHPATTLTAYLDVMIEHYKPENAAATMERLADLSKATGPLWVDTRDARRASGQLQAQFSQMQPKGWRLVDTAITGTSAELSAELTVGSALALQNQMMLKMLGGEKPLFVFKLLQVGNSWKLSGFIRKAATAGPKQ